MPPALTVLAVIMLAVLLGALHAALWARLTFARTGSTFRCKVHWPGNRRLPRLRYWSPVKVRATWVHDVLLVQRGVLRSRTIALPVSTPVDAMRPEPEATRLGARPVALLLRLDDGLVMDVAVRDRDIGALAGPFVAAALPALPPAPTEPWRPGA